MNKQFTISFQRTIGSHVCNPQVETWTAENKEAAIECIRKYYKNVHKEEITILG